MFRIARPAGAAFAGLSLLAALGSAAFVSTSLVPSAHATTRPAATQSLPNFADLFETQGAAVVNISTARTPRNGPPADPLDLFRGQPPQGNAPAPRGVGSGFIISNDGYLLTNAHVVAGASEVNVRLSDKREFKAKVVGSDRRTDVALLKINATGLPTVRIGDPNKVRVGEWVAAIGSPFGFENTVTAGIVSAKSRALPDDSYVPFIQTDVAINPGNSGGPLFNLNGEVIGINSQIYSRSGGYQGLSFSIPIDVAMRVRDDLARYGRVHRGRIGVTIQPVTNDLAESFGLANTSGALVNMVEPNGPADKAGVKSGDVIVAVDHRAIAQSTDLPRLIGEAKPGQTVILQVVRAGERLDLRVALSELPAERAAGTDPAPAQTAPTGRFGLAVRPLTPDEKRSVDGPGGVVVEQVSGAAARAGVRAGDVIIAINNKPVESVDQLKQIANQSRERAALLIQRDGTRLFVPLRLS